MGAGGSIPYELLLMLRFPLREGPADGRGLADSVSAAAGNSVVGDFLPAVSAVVRPDETSVAVLRRRSGDVDDDGVDSKRSRESPRASLESAHKVDPSAPDWAKRLVQND